MRTSYGITGNANLPDYQWIGTYSPAEENNPGYNGNDVIYPTNLENSDLKWEELYNFDVGLEFGFFKNRVFGEVA